MLLMICDQCASHRSLAEVDGDSFKPVNTVEGVKVGCFLTFTPLFLEICLIKSFHFNFNGIFVKKIIYSEIFEINTHIN